MNLKKLIANEIESNLQYGIGDTNVTFKTERKCGKEKEGNITIYAED